MTYASIPGHATNTGIGGIAAHHINEAMQLMWHSVSEPIRLMPFSLCCVTATVGWLRHKLTSGDKRYISGECIRGQAEEAQGGAPSVLFDRSSTHCLSQLWDKVLICLPNITQRWCQCGVARYRPVGGGGGAPGARQASFLTRAPPHHTLRY